MDLIDRNSLKIKQLEHVKIEKGEQLFRVMLQSVLQFLFRESVCDLILAKIVTQARNSVREIRAGALLIAFSHRRTGICFAGMP
jgi:hypothetical protein